MKAIVLTLILSATTFAATYKGMSIDGKKYHASTRINGVIEPVTVRFEGKGVEVWLDGEILPMKLADEVIEDMNAVTAYDGKQEFTLKVEMGN